MLRKASTTGRARPIVEAIAGVREDTKAFDTDWNAADSLTGLDVDAYGDLRLSSTPTTTIEHTVSDTFMTDLNNDSPFSTAKISWGGAQDADFEIRQLKIWLHPKRTGAAKEVVTWRLRLWRLHAVWATTPVALEGFELQAMGAPVDVAAVGTVEAEFLFDFTTNQTAPRPMLLRPIIRPGAATVIFPVTYIVVTALKANGDPAGNVGFSANTATPNVTTAGRLLQQSTLTVNTIGDGVGRYLETIVAECPRLSVIESTYANATVDFSIAGGVGIDLGAAPTGDVECIGVGRTPSDTALTFSVREAGSGSYLEFKDGDLIGVDNTPAGGKDLSSLAKQQTYDIRCLLATNTNLDTTPILQRLGMREVTRVKFDRLASQIDVEWQIDPFDLRGMISRATIRLIRDGRRDFNDAVTDLFRSHDVADIAFEIYIGHPELDRHKWLHIETFPFVYDYDPQDAYVECQWDSALVKLRAALPVVGAGPQRDILEYNVNVGIETLKDVSDDLLDGQVGLAARFRGQGIIDDTTTISKRIGERNPDAITTALSDAKEELDAVAFIAGGGWSTEAGRVRFFDLFTDDYIDLLFDEREIDIQSVSPGLAARSPEVFLAYDYDHQSKQYVAEHRGFHNVAITSIGVANLGPPKRLPDTVGQWVDTAALAASLVERHLDAFSTGLREWRFRTTYPHPELQLGDRVVLPTKKFVMRDPIADRELSGQLWVIGVVTGIHDVLGTQFTLWIRTLSDVLASSEAVTLELRKGTAVRVFHSANQVLTQPPSGFSIAWNSEVFDFGGLHDTATNNQRLTAPFAARYLVQGVISYTGAFHGTAGGTLRFRLFRNVTTFLGEIGTWKQGVSPAQGEFPFSISADLAVGQYVTVELTVSAASPGAGGITIVGGGEDDSSFEMTYLIP